MARKKSSTFKFKQFDIRQDHAMMKVNTDGVLLGAWVDFGEAISVLDIGTGTGVIALMIAQRTKSKTTITAIDIDKAAIIDATANAASSVYNEKVEVQLVSLQDFARQAVGRYDHIVTNPPYFEDGTLSPDVQKANVRHTHLLSFEDLCRCSKVLLTEVGKFSLILPSAEAEVFHNEAANHGLFLSRYCDVFVKTGKRGRRLMTYSNISGSTTSDEPLTIRVEDGDYSSEYKELTKEFYFNF